MDLNIVECEFAERDPGMCQCTAPPTLHILNDIHKAYEDRMRLVERLGGSNKLQMQVEVLRSWVSDLVGQNTLLARAVEDLESEATTRLLLERRRHSEIVSELRSERAALRRRVSRKESDVRGLVEVLRRLREFDYCTLDGIHFFEVTESDIFGSVEWLGLVSLDPQVLRQAVRQVVKTKPNPVCNMLQKVYCNDPTLEWEKLSKKKTVCRSINDLTIINEALQKENIAKDREIQKLNKDVQQYEQTIMNLRGELSLTQYHTPDVSKKDAEVMAGMCCTGTECGDWEPVKDKDITVLIREETLKYQERLQKMEENLKNSSKSVHALRKANIILSDETQAMRRMCVALDEQSRAATVRAQFKDEIIREIRRQLKQAKAKAPTCSRSCQVVVTSTPNISCEVPETYQECSPDISVIEPPSSPPIVVSDDSIAELERTFLKSCSCFQDMYKSERRSVLVQEPDKNEKETHVEELFVNEACSVGKKSKDYTQNSTCSKDQQDSVADSMSGSCDTSRAHYYHNKLMATMQILENKEQTVRVQSESLAVAEARIATLTTRISELRRDLDRKDRELQSFHKSAEERETTKTDVSVTALSQENEQRNVINTLQDNLAVIENLYRECFYETAKQECLIEMLRKSYLDVRVMDKQKADQIDRLQTVVNNQRRSLDRCQDIALEVENLKIEITNFLNSSNNDSGMWERSDASVTSGVGEDLHDIMDHLLRLREMLNSGCICGLEEENERLRKNNETLQLQVGELRQRVSDLESSLLGKDDKELFYQEQIDDRDKELHSIRKQLATLEESKCHQTVSCDALAVQLQQVEGLLKEKTSELAHIQKKGEVHENTIKSLRDELEKANLIIRENSDMRSEMSCVTSHARSCRARLADSECRARALEADLEHMHICYRQKAQAAEQLAVQLQEAQGRGAALCGTARDALDAVARWSRRHRHKRRELENTIKEKETMISSLQKRLDETQNASHLRTNEEASCSKCVTRRRDYDFPSCFSSTGVRREQCVGTSESERTSCSSAPVPPRRSRRKSSLCSDKRCTCSCSCSVSSPARSPARTPARTAATSPASCPRAGGQALHINSCHSPHIRMHRISREMSPTDDLLGRVEQLTEALADGQRRWTQRLQHR